MAAATSRGTAGSRAQAGKDAGSSGSPAPQPDARSPANAAGRRRLAAPTPCPAGRSVGGGFAPPLRRGCRLLAPLLPGAGRPPAGRCRHGGGCVGSGSRGASPGAGCGGRGRGLSPEAPGPLPLPWAPVWAGLGLFWLSCPKLSGVVGSAPAVPSFQTCPGPRMAALSLDRAVGLLISGYHSCVPSL